VDVSAFVDDDIGGLHLQVGRQLCAKTVRHTVFWPQLLHLPSHLDRAKGLLLVGGGEGNVVGRVPVSGQHHMLEHVLVLLESVDVGEDLAAVGHGQGATLAEIVLDVDYDQDFGHSNIILFHSVLLLKFASF